MPAKATRATAPRARKTKAATLLPARKQAAGKQAAGSERSRSERRPMTEAQKQAIARGRTAAAAVRRYLEALDSQKSRAGRRRSPEAMEKRLVQIDSALPAAAPLPRLLLSQERLSLVTQLAAARNGGPALETVEADFIRHAAAFTEAKGISYQAWRSVGVAPRVLKAAGIRK